MHRRRRGIVPGMAEPDSGQYWADHLRWPSSCKERTVRFVEETLKSVVGMNEEFSRKRKVFPFLLIHLLQATVLEVIDVPRHLLPQLLSQQLALPSYSDMLRHTFFQSPVNERYLATASNTAQRSAPNLNPLHLPRDLTERHLLDNTRHTRRTRPQRLSDLIVSIHKRPTISVVDDHDLLQPDQLVDGDEAGERGGDVRACCADHDGVPGGEG